MAKAATQTQLEGMQDPKIQEITDAAVAYSQTIRARLKIQATEAEEKKELMDLMKKHELDVYRDVEADVIVTLEEVESVKVEKPSNPKKSQPKKKKD